MTGFQVAAGALADFASVAAGPRVLGDGPAGARVTGLDDAGRDALRAARGRG